MNRELVDLMVDAGTVWVTYAVDSGPSVHIAGLDARARAVVLAGEAMLLPVVTLIVLLVTRRRFDQTAGRRAVRKLRATVTTALGVSCGANFSTAADPASIRSARYAPACMEAK